MNYFGKNNDVISTRDFLADNQKCIKKYGTSSVVAQTVVGAVIMLDLIANGVWYKPGIDF